MQQSRKAITRVWLVFICILYSRSTTTRTTCWIFRSWNFGFQGVNILLSTRFFSVG